MFEFPAEIFGAKMREEKLGKGEEQYILYCYDIFGGTYTVRIDGYFVSSRFDFGDIHSNSFRSRDGFEGFERNAAKLVNKVIEELKADYQEACDRLQTATLIKDKQIVELKAKLEDVKASNYTESVDAGMENRRLKRALWLARAAIARSMKTYEDLDNYTRNHLNRNSRWNYISSQRYDCWFYAWDNVERKCLKKAEQYK